MAPIIKNQMSAGKFCRGDILSERLDFAVENVRGWRGSFVDRCIDRVDNVLQEKERSGGHFVVTYICNKYVCKGLQEGYTVNFWRKRRVLLRTFLSKDKDGCRLFNINGVFHCGACC